MAALYKRKGYLIYRCWSVESQIVDCARR